MKEIYDVSNVVYGGYYAASSYRISGFPCGGVRKLLGMLNSGFQHYEQILCFDGGSTIKKELLPRYKSGRVPNYAVMAQLDLLREILEDCDIPFYWDEKYEGDDYICSMVHFLSLMRDPDELIVYSDDRDIACCVGDLVTVRNVTSNGATINRRNYEDRVVRGQRIPYNTILLYKMVFGDPSDNYAGISVPGLRFEDLAQSFLDAVQPFIDRGDLPESAYMLKDVVDIIIDDLPDNFTAEMKEQLHSQAKIVYPQIVDVTFNGYEAFSQDLAQSGQPHYQVEKRHIKVSCNGSFNQKKFDYYCSMFGLNRCRPERYGEKYTRDAEEFKQLLALRAKDLASGVTAVEKYRSRRTVQHNNGEVQNMQLPL